MIFPIAIVLAALCFGYAIAAAPAENPLNFFLSASFLGGLGGGIIGGILANFFTDHIQAKTGGWLEDQLKRMSESAGTIVEKHWLEGTLQVIRSDRSLSFFQYVVQSVGFEFARRRAAGVGVDHLRKDGNLIVDTKSGKVWFDAKAAEHLTVADFCDQNRGFRLASQAEFFLLMRDVCGDTDLNPAHLRDFLHVLGDPQVPPSMDAEGRPMGYGTWYALGTHFEIDGARKCWGLLMYLYPEGGGQLELSYRDYDPDRAERRLWIRDATELELQRARGPQINLLRRLFQSFLSSLRQFLELFGSSAEVFALVRDGNFIIDRKTGTHWFALDESAKYSVQEFMEAYPGFRRATYEEFGALMTRTCGKFTNLDFKSRYFALLMNGNQYRRRSDGWLTDIPTGFRVKFPNPNLAEPEECWGCYWSPQFDGRIEFDGQLVRDHPERRQSRAWVRDPALGNVFEAI